MNVVKNESIIVFNYIITDGIYQTMFAQKIG